MDSLQEQLHRLEAKISALRAEQALLDIKRLGVLAQLQSFPKFSLLPQELRAIVWDLITPEGAIVHCQAHDGPSTSTYDYDISVPPTPVILHVSQESRNHVKSRFESFIVYGIALYFRPCIDTLFLDMAFDDSIHFFETNPALATFHGICCS